MCTGDQVREVVSFDMDLMDCTVLACVLSAYCPFLVRYPCPLHNFISLWLEAKHLVI